MNGLEMEGQSSEMLRIGKAVNSLVTEMLRKEPRDQAEVMIGIEKLAKEWKRDASDRKGNA